MLPCYMHSIKNINRSTEILMLPCYMHSVKIINRSTEFFFFRIFSFFLFFLRMNPAGWKLHTGSPPQRPPVESLLKIFKKKPFDRDTLTVTQRLIQPVAEQP